MLKKRLKKSRTRKMTIDTITRETLIEKLKQYPTLLQQFMVLVDTQGTTLDDIQEILKLAQDASSSSTTTAEKVNTLSTKIDNEINRAVVEELSLQADVAKEKAERVASDTTLQTNLDGKQDKLTAGDNITIEGNVISSTAGSGADEKIEKLEDKIDNEINRALAEELSLQGTITKEKEDRVSADTALQTNIDGKQDKLTAGSNITIVDNVISATGSQPITDYVDLSSDQTISGVKTFTSEIKTNQIANANDNAMLRYKETENKVVIGGSTISTTIMGSSDRPTYSKNGSDFDGSPLALLSDLNNKQDKLTVGDNIIIGDETYGLQIANNVISIVKIETIKTYTISKLKDNMGDKPMVSLSLKINNNSVSWGVGTDASYNVGDTISINIVTNYGTGATITINGTKYTKGSSGNINVSNFSVSDFNVSSTSSAIAIHSYTFAINTTNGTYSFVQNS